MGISVLVRRLAAYHKRHGLRATLLRAQLAIKRVVLSSRQVVFYYDLANHTPSEEGLPAFLMIERKKTLAEIAADDLHEMVSFWNPVLAQRNIEERLGKGASLWLIRFEGQLAGYGWTLQGRPIAPYYFPLGEKDVQFFDFHIFPKFRGRAIDWFLMTQIFQALARDGAARAFAEAGEWNWASISSLTMVRFRRLGLVSKLPVFGRTIVWWDEKEGIKDQRKKKRKPLAAGQLRPSGQE